MLLEAYKQLARDTIEGISAPRTQSIETGEDAIEHIAAELQLDPLTVKKGLLQAAPNNSFTIATDNLLQEVVEGKALEHRFVRRLKQLPTAFFAAATGISAIGTAIVNPSLLTMGGTMSTYLLVLGGPLAFGVGYIVERLEDKFNRENEPHRLRLEELRKNLLEQAELFDQKYGTGDFQITAEQKTPQRAPKLD